MTHICKEKVSFHLPLHSHVCTEQSTAQATSSPLGTTSEVRPGWQGRRACSPSMAGLMSIPIQ